MLPNAEDGNVAFFDLRESDFPVVITFFSEATGKELHSITITEPGAIQIPGSDFFQERVTVTVKAAGVAASSGEDEEKVSACPNCGMVSARTTYDIGSGPELSCANCEWCWGAAGQDLKPLNPAAAIKCPNCGRINECHDGPKPGDTPEDGDLSMCWQCHSVNVYIETEDGLSLRAPTPEEAGKLANLPEVKEALALIDGARTPGEASKRRWAAKDDEQCGTEGDK